jgi:hypothetical protein
VVVEQLLLAARGVNANEEGDFFTGRVEPLAELVAWIGRGEVGVALVSGPAGCGTSALLGRITALSNPQDRQLILERGALAHADPGEHSVAAAAAARGANQADLVRRLEAELVRSGLLSMAADEPRNRLELLGAMERLAQKGNPPLLLIDGFDEATARENLRAIAELAIRYRDSGVVGFDIAGAEAGFPPSRHLDAFEYMRSNNARFTIHAGEAFGLPSIHEAIAFCGADRLGHGVRIVDDIEILPDGGAALGRVAGIVRDRRIPLEMCPSSNVQTGAVASIDKHPFDLLARLRFRVTVNTDNRLMSDTTMSREMFCLAEAFGYGWSDLERFTVNAMKSAFIHFDERLAIIDEVIKPRYAVLMG